MQLENDVTDTIELKQSCIQTLLDRLEAREATIGIAGMGYVGQPLALRYSDSGFRVLGFDIDPEKVAGLNAGHSSIEHIDDAAIARAVAGGMEATSDMTRATEADALIICVPTPLNKYREPDLSFVIDTLEALLPYLRAGQVISLESTTYPGTTEKEIVTRIEARGVTVGKDVFVVYSPEREDPGNAHFNTQTIPKVVGGHTPDCLAVGQALYGGVIDHVVPVSSTRAAEMTKLLENIHRSVNIGERDEGGGRPHGDRHFRGDRRRGDKTLRVHGLLPRPRSGGALHSHRPVLPDLEGARIRAAHPVHRACGRDQPVDARICAGQADQGPERPPQGPERQSHSGAWHCLHVDCH
jgi:hypothetical protein